MSWLSRRTTSGTPRVPPASPTQPSPGTPPAPSQTRSIIPDDPPKFDHTLGTLASAIAILKAASEMTYVPFLKGAADVALTLVETARTYRANQTGSAELAYHAVYLTAALCEDCPKEPNENVSRAIEAFKKELEAIADNMKDLSSKRPWNLKALLATKVYADKIKAYRDSLYMAYMKFSMSLGLDTNAAVSRMEQQALRADEGLQDLRRDTMDIKRITLTTLDAVCTLSTQWVFTPAGAYTLVAMLIVLMSLALNTNQTTLLTIETASRIEGHSAESKQTTADIKEDTESIKRDTADIKQHTEEIRTALKGQKINNSLPSVALPPKPEIFYGREEYVEKVVDTVINKPDARVAILGPGGMGKTSIALAVMHDPRVANRFKNNYQHWVPCETATSPEFLVELLATSIKVPKNSNDRLTDVVNTLKMPNQRHIILLDNFETLMDIENKRSESENILRTIALPNVTILVTMRGALPPSGFQWASPHLQPLSLDAARQTFLAICSESESEPDNRLNELLLALDCVPLAVNLMASIAKLGETPTELLERWKEERTPLLHLAGDRLNSVDESIRISLESTPLRSKPEAIQLLAILSMLPGGAQRDFIKEVAPSIKNLKSSLAILARVSLAYRSPDNTAIHVLSPIRSYMLHHHKLTPPTREDVYKAYYAMAKRGNCFGKPEFVDTARELSKEAANLESVLLDALQCGDRRAAIKASLQYSRHLYFTVPRITVISAAVEIVKNSECNSLHAKIVEMRGKLYSSLGRNNEAQSDMDMARRLFEHTGSALGAAECLRNLGDIHRMQGQYDEARSVLQMARDRFYHIGSPIGVAQCLQRLGDIHRMHDRYDEARSHLQMARDQSQHFGDPLGAAQCLMSLGDIHLKQGRYDNARSDLQMARDQFQHIGEPLGAAQCLKSLGVIHLEQGRYDEALSDLEMARDQLRHIGEPIAVAQCLMRLGDIHLVQGRYDKARSNLQMARDQYQHTGDPLGVAQCLKSLGNIHGIQGQYNEARSNLRMARDQFQHIGEPLDAAQCLSSLGNIHGMQGRYDEARSDLEMARDQFQHIGYQHGVTQCQGILEYILHQQRYDNQAISDVRNPGRTSK